jgi:hypothetical protein
LTHSAARGDAKRAVHLPPPLRFLVTLACTELAFGAISATPVRAAGPAQIRDVEDSLSHDQSFKVRVEAALILGRLRQVRSVPVLIGALRDPQPGVRSAAADSLGQIGSLLPRDALVAALHDPEPSVRRAARAALRRLGSTDDLGPREPGEAAIRPHTAVKPSFEIKAVGDPEHRAGPALRSHMRDFLVDQLRPFGDVDPSEHRGTYAVDGVIKNLSQATTHRDVEVSCAVQLVVSRQPSGGVFMLTNGEATVQKPKLQWKPQLRPSMELEALEAAVRGASEDLIGQLARQ